MLRNLVLLAALVIPPENQGQPPQPPLDIESAMAETLVAAIAKDDAVAIKALEFPREAFIALKDIPRPGDYHTKLSEWFAADIHREHQRLAPLGPLEVVSLKVGRCRWKAVGTEANKIAYWSCSRTTITVKGESGKEDTITVRALINWGPRWYVTHLGPPPKDTRY